MKVVFKPFDIIFAKIGASLYFDDFKRFLEYIRETVDRTYWYIGRLVFLQHKGVVCNGHLGPAPNHYPVFRAVLMAL